MEPVPPPPETDVSDRSLVERAPWSPAQLVALLIGAFLVLIGGIALARGGFDDITSHVTVMGIHQTPLLGIIHLVFGAFMLMAGAVPGAGRGTMAFFGAVALVFGIVVASEATRMHGTLGTHQENGWLYIAFGIASLIAAFAAPVISGSRRVARRTRAW